MATLTPAASSHAQSRHHGFSLIELLVVMSIVLLFAGLGLTAFLRLPTVNRLTAAEQAIGGAIRQARTTARTTGNPVVLELESTASGDSSIRGTSATVLWSERFEGTQGYDPSTPVSPQTFPLEAPTAVTADGTNTTPADLLAHRRAPEGWSGAGLWYENPGNPTVAIDNTIAPPVGRLETCTLDEKRGRYIRPKDGLMLELKVRVQGNPPYGYWVPLVLACQEKTYDHTNPPKITESAYGLAIRWQQYDLYDPSSTGVATQRPQILTSPYPFAFKATAVEWCAWVGDKVVDSWEHRPAHLPAPDDPDIDKRREFINRVAALDHQAWHTVQFLATAKRMSLIVDGVMIADRNPGFSTIDAATNVYAGMAIVDDWLPIDPPRFPAGFVHNTTDPIIMPPSIILDDLRLLRLSGGTVAKLPPGLSCPTTQLMCLPDGRVLVNNAAVGSSAEIEIAGQFDEANDRAKITIQADGTTSSTVGHIK